MPLNINNVTIMIVLKLVMTIHLISNHVKLSKGRGVSEIALLLCIQAML